MQIDPDEWFVRVCKGGDTFTIAVTANGDEDDRVKLVTGPYAA